MNIQYLYYISIAIAALSAGSVVVGILYPGIKIRVDTLKNNQDEKDKLKLQVQEIYLNQRKKEISEMESFQKLMAQVTDLDKNRIKDLADLGELLVAAVMNFPANENFSRITLGEITQLGKTITPSLNIALLETMLDSWIKTGKENPLFFKLIAIFL